MIYNQKNIPIDLISIEDLQKLLEEIKNIKYGSVTLVIQDGRIIQYDKIEKTRLI